MFIANIISSGKNSNKLFDKSTKSKTRKVSKFQKLIKFKNLLKKLWFLVF